MDVSIIIINYNTFELTCNCIASIFEKTKAVSFEVILVDNASSETNPKQFLAIFPKITLIESKTNLGFAGGNNLGLKAAKGEVVLLLNSDTVLVNDAISICFNQLLLDAKIGVVSARLIYPDGKEQSSAHRFPSISLELIELLRLQKIMSPKKRSKLLLGAFFDHKSSVEADWVWGTFFMTRQEVINKLPEKKLPDEFFMYGEDVQWCFYIKQLGYKVIYNAEATVIHLLSASTNNNKQLDKAKMMLQHEHIFLNDAFGELITSLIFRLRALKYLSLSFKNPDFKNYYNLYWKAENWK